MLRIEELYRDVVYAIRHLRRTPAFTVAAILTLALAIGANASIFAVVERVVMNPLPYPESNRLIEVDHAFPPLNVSSGVGMTSGLYYQYLDRAHTLDGIAIYRVDELTLTGGGEPERIRVTGVTPTFAPVLRVQPAIGRWFRDEEAAIGAPQVAILSHAMWMRRYGGATDVLGRSVVLNGVPTEIVGVMPASFAFPDSRVDAWMAFNSFSRTTGFGLPYRFTGIARLRDGVTLPDVRNELSSLTRDLPRVYPGDAGVAGYSAPGQLISTAITLKESTIGQIERALWILLASVGLVLLIACANVANLFLVRAETRQREVAVRRVLGLGAGGVARLFLSESALLSIVSGFVGIALASVALGLLVDYAPAGLPRLEEIRLDGVAIAFTFVLTLLVALAFGAIPLLRKAPISMFLYDGGRNSTVSRGRHRVRHLLMGGQVALALVLLVSSGLMLRSFLKLRALDPGFNPTSVLTFRLGLPAAQYRNRAAAAAAHRAILDRLSELPGVTAVSASSGVPLRDACFGNTIRVENRVYPSGTIPAGGRLCAVAGGYVEAMGMRLLRGRGIERGDVERGERIAIVNQAFAETFFPNDNPIGHRVRSNAPPGPTTDDIPPWLEIVGVVSNTPVAALAETRRTAVLYMPMSIAGGPDIPALKMLGPNIATMSYIVRSMPPATASLRDVRRAIDMVDPNLAIAQTQTLEEILDRGSAQMSFTMVLLTIAASVALMLGVIGIYGVVSYIVSQRTAEMGIRLALGAEPRTLMRMIVVQSGRVTVVGITLGIVAALVGGRLIQSLLFDVDPHDPVVIAATALTLLVVAVLACWLPARRAARLNPIEVLRMN